MNEEESKSDFERAISNLKETFKSDRVFGWIYRKMITLLDIMENILENTGGNKK